MRNLTIRFLVAFLSVSIVIFGLFAQPVFGMTPPYNSVQTSSPANGYCYYSTYWWECVNGSTSNGNLIILANASADSGHSNSAVADLLFNGPELTTSSGSATVTETLSFNGAVAESGSSSDGIFRALIGYLWQYCGVLPCSQNVESTTVLIWDAALDGSYVISCSQCGYSWSTSLHSSWINEYWGLAGSKTQATATSTCSYFCTVVWGKADFSNGGYNNVVNAITMA